MRARITRFVNWIRGVPVRHFLALFVRRGGILGFLAGIAVLALEIISVLVIAWLVIFPVREYVVDQGKVWWDHGTLSSEEYNMKHPHTDAQKALATATAITKHAKETTDALAAKATAEAAQRAAETAVAEAQVQATKAVCELQFDSCVPPTLTPADPSN